MYNLTPLVHQTNGRAKKSKKIRLRTQVREEEKKDQETKRYFFLAKEIISLSICLDWSTALQR